MRLLDGFSVRWTACRSMERPGTDASPPSSSQLLALTPGARLHRERVVDALWPDLPLEQALPRLHKAAHFARRALGPAPGILELRQDVVTLAAGHTPPGRRRRVRGGRPPSARPAPTRRHVPARAWSATSRPSSFPTRGGVGRGAPRPPSGAGGRAAGCGGAVGGAAEARPRERGRAPGVAAVGAAPWRPRRRAARLRLHGAGARGGAAGLARCGRARPARCPGGAGHAGRGPGDHGARHPGSGRAVRAQPRAGVAARLRVGSVGVGSRESRAGLR